MARVLHAIAWPEMTEFTKTYASQGSKSSYPLLLTQINFDPNMDR